jgi:hypothetical protein
MKKIVLSLSLIIAFFVLSAQTFTEYKLPVAGNDSLKGQGYYLKGEKGIKASFQYLNLDKNANENQEIKFVKPPTSLKPIKQVSSDYAGQRITHHLTLRFNIMSMGITMTSENNSYQQFNWSSGNTIAEIDAEEGVYDILINAYDFMNSGDLLYVFLHGLNLISDVDTTINLIESASNYLYFHGLDENGFPLLPDDTTLLTNVQQISIEFPSSFVFQSASMAIGGSPKDYVRFSDVNSNYLIDLWQSNVRQGKMFVLDLAHLNGIAQDTILESAPDNYEKMSAVFYESPSANNDYLTFSTGIIFRLREDPYYLWSAYIESNNSDYFSHNQDTVIVFLSNVFQPANLCNFVGAVSFWEDMPGYGVPEKRFSTNPFYIMTDDTIQFCKYYPPVKADYKVPGNSVVSFGNSMPYANIKSVNEESTIFNYSTLFGQSSENRTLDNYASLYYIMQGTDILQSDTLVNFIQPYTIPGSGPYSFSITDSNFYISGIQGKMIAQNTFNLPNDDPNPPVLTSFKILNSDGLLCNTFESDAQAFVHLSVADYTDNGLNDVSAVYLYYKEHNEESWTTVPVQEMPEFYDPVFQYGQYFIGDLSTAINTYNYPIFFIDLKLEVLDGANNILTESFYPAFKVLNSVGIGNPDQSDHKLNILIYPNPSHDVLSIKTNNMESGMVSLSIFDSRGQKIIDKTFSNKIDLNVSTFSGGVYYLKLQTGEFNEVRKIVVK